MCLSLEILLYQELQRNAFWKSLKTSKKHPKLQPLYCFCIFKILLGYFVGLDLALPSTKKTCCFCLPEPQEKMKNHPFSKAQKRKAQNKESPRKEKKKPGNKQKKTSTQRKKNNGDTKKTPKIKKRNFQPPNKNKTGNQKNTTRRKKTEKAKSSGCGSKIPGTLKTLWVKGKIEPTAT